jgi:hypothetical protein
MQHTGSATPVMMGEWHQPEWVTNRLPAAARGKSSRSRC